MSSPRPLLKRAAAFAAGAVLAALAAGAHAQGLRPSTVESFTPGIGAGFGSAFFPANVLAGPDGGENPPFLPNASEQQLLALGSGGAIVLRWDGDVILDGPGPDFIVFENVFLEQTTGNPFMEAGIVSAGKTATALETFPFRFEPPPGWDAGNPFAIPLTAVNLPGVAGTQPTLATAANGIDPADPALAGGNAFDLADLGLTWAGHIEIRDPKGPLEPGAALGSNGLPIYDTPVGLNGFDLDTVVAIHFGPLPASASEGWALYE
ncbi:MAG: hypothetical protein SF028_14350 [Candidatus Sumerlaeia bacterium]|nr:hypothetical protein [Candidatus Sumerlaeia bacterium]